MTGTPEIQNEGLITEQNRITHMLATCILFFFQQFLFYTWLDHFSAITQSPTLICEDKIALIRICIILLTITWLLYDYHYINVQHSQQFLDGCCALQINKTLLKKIPNSWTNLPIHAWNNMRIEIHRNIPYHLHITNLLPQTLWTHTSLSNTVSVFQGRCLNDSCLLWFYTMYCFVVLVPLFWRDILPPFRVTELLQVDTVLKRWTEMCRLHRKVSENLDIDS